MKQYAKRKVSPLNPKALKVTELDPTNLKLGFETPNMDEGMSPVIEFVPWEPTSKKRTHSAEKRNEQDSSVPSVGISSESSVMKKEKKLVIEDLWLLLDKRQKRPNKGTNQTVMHKLHPCKFC